MNLRSFLSPCWLRPPNNLSSVIINDSYHRDPTNHHASNKTSMVTQYNWDRVRASIIGLMTCCFLCFKGYSQHDSLILTNNNIIVGEIKSLNNGVITIETDYSKNDFTIEWPKVKRIYSKTNFLVTLANGQRINGPVRSSDTTNRVVISGIDGITVGTVIDSIVYLKGVKSQFWSRVYGGIDLGLNLTKANDLRQFDVRSTFGYIGNRWQGEVYYNDLRSVQDSTTETKRTESGLGLKYFLPKDWFIALPIDLLSNTEQALDLRTTASLALGKFIAHTNRSYWALAAGASLNHESFTNDKENRQSTEGFLGSELNLFDIGDFSLKNTTNVYGSFTEAGRWRVDFTLDTKYDLPLDLYLKLGLTFNYDNRPAIEGSQVDYVLGFGIGWEFNK
jgi:hypothetical protein